MRTSGRTTGYGAFVQAATTVPGLDRARSRHDRVLARGVIIGGCYRIEDELGRGGLGTVFRARDLELGRPVAVKVLHVEWPAEVPGELPQLLEREARATAVLNHPNIVTVHRYGMCEGLPFIVLELLTGESLGTRIARGPLPLAEAVRLIQQILGGLAHAHAHGLIHRDLSPGNVFVRDDGVVKILDFGLSTLRVGGSQTPARALPGQTLLGAGTPGFMAPEQARGEPLDARSDLWSVGALLAYMLTGDPASAALPAPVAACVARARADAPDARFADANQMRAALGPPARWSRRRLAAVATTGIAAVVAGAIALGAATSAAPGTAKRPEALSRTRSPAARWIDPDEAPALEGTFADLEAPDTPETIMEVRRTEHGYAVLIGNKKTPKPMTAENALSAGEGRVYRVGDQLYFAVITNDHGPYHRKELRESRIESPNLLHHELYLTGPEDGTVDGFANVPSRWTRIR